MKYAVQLYSLSNYIQTNGLDNTLKMILDAGYEGVEFAGFYNLKANEIKSMLDKYHLKAVSAHIPLHNIESQLDYLLTLNISYVVIPYISFEEWRDNSDKIIDKIKEVQKLLKQHQIVLGYHNHAHEFKDHFNFIQLLADKIPSILLQFDVCWLTYAHQDIALTFDCYQKHLKLIHIKDFSTFENVTLNTPLIGEGKVDMKTVFNKCQTYFIEWCILEAENIQHEIPYYLNKSLQNMKILENQTN